MKKKTAKTIYRFSITLTSLWFAACGLFQLTKYPAIWEITVKLGYPHHFIYLLGVAKLVGVGVLLIPGKLLRLKEWVFAGLFFDSIIAFVSRLSVLGFPATFDAITALILVSVTYFMFRKVYRMSPLQYALAMHARYFTTSL